VFVHGLPEVFAGVFAALGIEWRAAGSYVELGT